MSDHDPYHAERALRAAEYKKAQKKALEDARDRIAALEEHEEHARRVALTRACGVGPGRCEQLPPDAPIGSNPWHDNTGFAPGAVI